MQINTSQFNFDTAPDSALVKSDFVMQINGGISRATLDRRIKDGVIPKPVIANRVRYWKVGELREALQKLTEPSQPDSQVQA